MATYEVEVAFRTQRFKDASKGFDAYMAALNKGWDGAAKLLARELQVFLDGVAEALAQRHGAAYPGTTPTGLAMRSGNLVKSILDSVEVKGTTWKDIEGKIGAAFPAQVHEFGATIVAKGKYLTIPLPSALDSRGLPLKKSAREWDNTFVAKTKAGNLLIFQKRGTQIVPLYVLKEQVVIPPRLGMRDTLKTGIPYFVDKTMDKLVKAVLAAS